MVAGVRRWSLTGSDRGGGARRCFDEQPCLVPGDPGRAEVTEAEREMFERPGREQDRAEGDGQPRRVEAPAGDPWDAFELDEGDIESEPEPGDFWEEWDDDCDSIG